MDDLSYVDIKKLAREAGVLEPIELLESNQWRQDTLRELSLFAALLLEKAAQKADSYGHQWSGAPAHAFFELANDIRQMAAGMGE